MKDKYEVLAEPLLRDEFLTHACEFLFGADRSDSQGIVEAMTEKKKKELCDKMYEVLRSR